MSASSSNVSGLPGSPVCFSPTYSDDQYIPRESASYSVLRIIVLPEFPGCLSILDNNRAIDTVVDGWHESWEY